MVCHRSACRFYDAFGINAVVFSDGGLQRRVAVTVLPINFEFRQIHWKFARGKCRHATRCEIESRATLRLRPMHVVRMLVSHEWVRLNLVQK